MRGKSGSILLGLGVFLLVTAALSQFWAYPNLAVAPIDQDSVTTLTAEGATVFNTATLTEETTDLTISAKTVGDIEASKEASDDAGEDVRVWVSTSSTRDSDGVIRSRSVERAGFDAYDAEAIECCDAFSETEEGNRESIQQQGLVFKFPFKVEKKSYPFWDASVGEAVDAEYVREDEVDGMSVYVFEQVVEPTVVDTLELPASLLGEEGEETLSADRVYRNTRTFYVETVTGAVLNRTEQQLSTLQYDGSDRVTVTEAEASYTQETIESTADSVRTKALLLRIISPILPIVFLVLGVLAVVGGLLLVRRRSAQAPPSPARRKEPVPT